MSDVLVAISNSEVATWDRCRRQWLLKYYMGMVPAEEVPVGNAPLGTRVHAALEGMYGYDLDPLQVLDVLYALAIEANPDYRTDLLAERETAMAMVSGYVEWVAETGADSGLRVVATEADVTVPLPARPGMQGVALRARMDQVGISEDTGLLSFLDWKTAATLDAHELLALNPQFKFYSVVQRLAVAARPGAPRVDGGIISTLRRVKRTGKSSPPYYQRDAFRYTEVELDAAQARIEKVCHEIMMARWQLDSVYQLQGGDLDAVNALQRSDLYPSPRPHECRWDCPFVQVCPMMDDGSDWPGALLSSGRYRQADPYSYYREDPLRAVRELLGSS